MDSVHVTCTLCTAGQTVELKCYVCDKVKGLEDFAKNQRKDPDNARCTKCVGTDIETESDLYHELYHKHPDNSIHHSSSDDEEEEEYEVCVEIYVLFFGWLVFFANNFLVGRWRVKIDCQQQDQAL